MTKTPTSVGDLARSSDFREVRATYDEATIRVYQAYSDAIAEAALAAGRFVAPFTRGRMTWIKPSFRWMMYRSGYARKDQGQHRILAIDMTRSGFEWALRHSCLSDVAVRAGRDEGRRLLDAAPVRVQWDPERDLAFRALGHRSIQIGLSGAAVDRYVDEWTVALHDVTMLAHAVGDAVDGGDLVAAAALLPAERTYPLPADVAAHIEASPGPTAT